MAILKIARMGHPVLQGAAQPVGDAAAPEVAWLVADMVETLADAGGVGLAAPQVHVPLRIVVFRVPAARNGGEEVPLTVLVNPVVEPIGDETETAYEACLSVPGLTGPVTRPLRIRYRGTTPAGDVVERVAEGFHARVVQHECDHLDGVLYPQRMTDLGRLAFVDELDRPEIAAPA